MTCIDNIYFIEQVWYKWWAAVAWQLQSWLAEFVIWWSTNFQNLL